MPYLGQSPSKGDENNFKILDDISSYTLTFDGSDASVVSAANDTITSLNHRFVQGQRVTYNKGGGSVIVGLSDGVYYIIKHDHHTIKLATSASNATNGVAVNITNVGSGSSHTLNVAFDGINTKFKATHTNGQKAKITRSAQLVVSVNGVIQQPHDTATPSTGFGFDLDGTIVLSQAPVAGDIYWAHVLTNNNVTFDISDNDVDNFTGNGSTVSFNLSKTPPDNRNVLVTIDGVIQYPNDPDGTVRAYNVVENVLTFTTAPASATEIQVRHIGFAGSTSGGGGVTNFYGRTGSVVLKNTDNIVANNAEFAGNLTVQGTMTTLDTKVTEVDQLEVAANNTTVGVAITQSGSGNILSLYDGTAELFTVADGGNVTIKNITGTPNFNIQGTNASNVAESNLNFLLRDGNSADRTVAKVVARNTGNGGYGALDFYTAFNNTNTRKMSIHHSGNVGIASVIPEQRLTVVGATDIKHYPNTTINNDRLQLGFNAPEGYIKAKNSTGSPAANIALYTTDTSGNTNRTMHLRYNGDVGIGTNAPRIANSLDIFYKHFTLTEGYPVTWLDGNSTTKKGRFLCDSGGNYLFQFGSNNEEKIRFKSDGKVGIGTNNPGRLLTLFDNDQPVFQITNNTSGLANTRGSIFYQMSGTTTLAIDNQGGGTGGNIQFMSAGNNTLQITSGGDVKINRTTGLSGAKLSITKDANEEGIGVQLNQSTGITTSFTTFNSAGQQIFSLAHDTDSTPDLIFKVKHSDTGGPEERFRITSSGTVGVNCTPTAAPLEVKQLSADGGALRLRDSSAQYRYLEFDVTGALTQITARSNNSHGSIDIGTLDQFGRTTQLYIKGGANAAVGIGTNNPADILHLRNTAPILKVDATNNQSGLRIDILGQTGGSNNQLFRVQRDATTKFQINDDGDVVITGDDNSELKLKAGTSTGNDIIAFLNSSGTTKGQIFYDTDDNFMVFKTDGTASSNERLRIKSGGGFTFQQGNSNYQTDFIGGSTNGRNFVSIHAGNTTSGHSSGFKLNHSDGNGVVSMFINHNDDHGHFMNEHQGGDILFYTNASGSSLEKLRITSTGQFVVGTNPTVNSGNIAHIEAPTSFNSGETIIAVVGDNGTAGPRLLLQNKNTGGSAHGEIPRS